VESVKNKSDVCVNGFWEGRGFGEGAAWEEGNFSRRAAKAQSNAKKTKTAYFAGASIISRA